MQVGGVTLGFPWALLLLLLAPYLVAVALRSSAAMPARQRWLSLGVRALALAVFALALANPSRERSVERVCAALLVDVSRSIPKDAAAASARWAASLARARPAGATLATFLFAGRSAPAAPGELAAPPPAAAAKLDPERSRIGAALLQAASLLPRECARRIVLLSDGRETGMEPALLPDRLGTLGAKVYPIELRGAPAHEIIVEEMAVPPVVRTQTPFTARLSVYSSAPATATVTARAALEGGEPALFAEEAARELAAGVNVIELTGQVQEEGRHLMTAEVTGAGGAAELFDENNRFESAFVAQGPTRVLYVEGEPARGGPLKAALGSAGYKVDMEGPGALAGGEEALAGYDALFLSDVAYGRLPAGAAAKIKKYAAEGGVFVFAGGKSSYAMGGYRQTPFEGMLPVSMEVEKEVQKVSTAVVLVLDKSGSMGGLPIQMAREAAKASIAVLDPDTLVEVIVFDSSPRRLFQMQKAGDKMMIASFVSQIMSGGGTNIIAALTQAYHDLVPVQAKKKHIVLLTDGQSSKVGVEGILAKAGGSNITISTIGLGTSVDRAFLEKIAVETGGKSSFTTNPKALPRLFMQEMKVVAPSSVVEGALGVEAKKQLPFVVKAGSLPYLRGYNLTTPKGGKNVLVLVSSRGDPVLAVVKHGKGWIVAFTSDVKARWASAWTAWKGFGRFWGELVRFLGGREKKQEQDEGSMTLAVEEGKVRVAVDLVDRGTGEFVEEAAGSGVSWRLTGDKAEKEFALAQTAPGRYEGEVPLDGYGAWFLRTKLAAPGGFVEQASASLNIPYPPEYRAIGPDTELLGRIAAKTGGKVNPTVQEVWSREGSEVKEAQLLWPWLALLLLLLLPLDIFIRRL